MTTPRNRVSVSLGALRHNVATVREHLQGRHLIAVVKADAYGLGIERCARIYHEAGAHMLAVASVSEARRVRSAVPAARILILGQVLPHEREEAVALACEACVSTGAEIDGFCTLGSAQAPIPVHLFVDTGMGRAGCAPTEALALAVQIRNCANLSMVGIGSHYPEAQDASFSAEQERCFADVLQAVQPPADCLVHLANSEGAMVRPAIGNAARIGLLLTGVTPPGCPDWGLQPALCWQAAVTLVKELPAGHSVSYNRTFRMPAAGPIGLVPVGYADGYPLAASGRAQVVIGTCRCPVLGRVTMDYLVIDLRCCPEVAVGDAVELVGAQMTVTELAEAVGSIPYDILCGLRGRCEVVSVA